MLLMTSNIAVNFMIPNAKPRRKMLTALFGLNMAAEIFKAGI